MASVLRQHGHYVRIVDHSVRPGDPLNCGEYDFVGVTCDTARFFEAAEVCKQAKAAGVPVVVGGAHATFCDSEFLVADIADFVIRKEGEESLLDLAENLHRPQNYGDVKGLSFKEGNEIIRNPDRPFVLDLDSFPYPARDLLPLNDYKMTHRGRPMTSIVTSRGCPYDCEFCSASRLAGCRWRSRDPIAVVDEVQEVSERYGFGSVAFVDDNFTANHQRVIDISREMRARKLDVTSWLQARTDGIVKHPEMVEAMADAGVRTVFLGIESGDDIVLKGYDKHADVDTARQAVRILKKYRIRPWCSFIIGGLDETRDAVLKTIEFAKDLRPALVQFSILTPYPGCRLYEKLKDLLLTRDWGLYDGAHSVMPIKHISSKELESLLFKAYRSFYLQPSQIINMIQSRFKGGFSIKGMFHDIRWIWNIRSALVQSRSR
jgi:anaerobic magnesium-protoporphyrin IX monomethyl ester cyclase